MALTPGTWLGSYQVLTRVGTGVANEEYSARHRESLRLVGIRVVSGPLSEGAKRHFRLLRQLRSPHIESFYEFGETGEGFFLVFERVEGESLERRLEKSTLSRPEILRIVGQLGSGLEAAHRQGVVCGNLSSTNVRLTPDGDAKILGLGSLRPLQWPWWADGSASGGSADTEEWLELGLDFRYLAPEQILGEPLQPRTDVFLLALVAFRLLSGRDAFPGSDAAAIVGILNTEPALPEAWKSEVELRRVFRRALDKNPESRYGSVTELVEDLESVLTQRPQASPPSVNRTIGRYRLIREIAQGGMGTVYLATDPSSNREVLVETLPADDAGSEERRKRFQRAALTAARLKHPNIVEVYEYGDDRGELFMATERLKGRSLDELTRDEEIAPAESLRIAAAVCRGLSFAHRQGILHRDLEPAHVFVTESGEIKITDFDLGGQDEREITMTRSLMVDYASPEHVAGERLDHRSDLFSVGSVLYRMLAHRKPFAAENLVGTVYKILNERPPPLELPPHHAFSAVQPVLDRALAKNPRERYQTADEMAEAIERVLRGARGETQQESLADVQFTAYRPKAIRAGEWYPLTVFTHLAEAPPGAPDPSEVVARQAERHLEAMGHDPRAFAELRQDASQSIPRESELTLVPNAAGLTFNPPLRTFSWVKDVHQEDFDLCAASWLEGQTATGTLTVFRGALILADIPLRIPVRHDVRDPTAFATERTQPYRNVFASYSHLDAAIVEQVEHWSALGDRYFRDIRVLSSGEQWSERILKLIESADVFQLFWSWNARASLEVTREWSHALRQPKRSLLRPCYWEDPMPPAPDALSSLHFQFLPVVAPPARPDPRERTGSFRPMPEEAPLDATMTSVEPRETERTGRVRVPSVPPPRSPSTTGRHQTSNIFSDRIITVLLVTGGLLLLVMLWLLLRMG